MGTVYVYGTNLYIWKEQLSSGEDVWLETQKANTAWGKLLYATALKKSDKYFWYLVDYDNVNREWQYWEKTDNNLHTPIPDTTYELIEQVDINLSKQTLGVWDWTSGGSEKHIEATSKNMEE